MSNERQPPVPGFTPPVRARGRHAAGITIVPRHVLGAGLPGAQRHRERRVVGYAHGMGTSNLMNVAKSDNIVALCDCDTARPRRPLAKNGIRTSSRRRSSQGLPRDAREAEGHRRGARRHTRSHPAVVAMAAMQLGKHVYVQKPLTRTISEARALTEAARKYKVVTQMGNQGTPKRGCA
jgi:hypothetical protein